MAGRVHRVFPDVHSEVQQRGKEIMRSRVLSLTQHASVAGIFCHFTSVMDEFGHTDSHTTPLSSANKRGCTTLVVNCSWMNEDIDSMLNWKHVACLNCFCVYTDRPFSSGYCRCVSVRPCHCRNISIHLSFDDWSYTCVSGACLWWVRRNLSFSFTRCHIQVFL